MVSDQSTLEQFMDSAEQELAGTRRETPEEAVIRLEQELALATKKVQVVGSVTRHDILNQMTAIMGYNELLLSMVQDENIRSFLEIEQRASDKIRRVFAYSKVFQLMGNEPPRWQKLGALIRLSCDEIDTGKVRIHEDTGDMYINAETQFYKVFTYLFDNSIRHGKKTTEIKITLDKSGKDPVLIVWDNGEGIAKDDKEKVFERGFGKHTGWGLFVTREILAVNGMTIRENGPEGGGARFEITIPEGRIRVGGKPPVP